MSRSIGILGCGWLGFPLAKTLMAHNYEVYGTTTSGEKMEPMAQAGIQPYKIALHPDKIVGDIDGFLARVNHLVINVPPRLRKINAESYVDKMKLLHSKILQSNIQNIIFVSSTSVYGNIAHEITESTAPQPVTESGRQLLICEALFQNTVSLNTTVIRFGGLIGPGRHPVTMLSKKRGLSNGNDPINLIHLEDCIHIIQTVLEKRYWNEIFNAVYPYHPTKEEYYTQEALKRGIPAPIYASTSSENIKGIVKSRNFINKKHTFYTSIVS